MASKRRNIFHKNKTQEMIENEKLAAPGPGSTSSQVIGHLEPFPRIKTEPDSRQDLLIDLSALSTSYLLARECHQLGRFVIHSGYNTIIYGLDSVANNWGGVLSQRSSVLGIGPRCRGDLRVATAKPKSDRVGGVEFYELDRVKETASRVENIDGEIHNDVSTPRPTQEDLALQ
ncbi:hypothetical protein AAG570_011631 [Ranatra chinensis]|uniref:Uncharacterized protein n=1 Tax=Ranatra chinensis TaxID=642074 RepID=A0ABD0YLJ9_9HEMI